MRPVVLPPPLTGVKAAQFWRSSRKAGRIKSRAVIGTGDVWTMSAGASPRPHRDPEPLRARHNRARRQPRSVASAVAFPGSSGLLQNSSYGAILTKLDARRYPIPVLNHRCAAAFAESCVNTLLTPRLRSARNRGWIGFIRVDDEEDLSQPAS